MKLEELEAEGVETEDKKKKKKKKKKKNPNTIRLQDQVNPAQTVVVEVCISLPLPSFKNCRRGGIFMTLHLLSLPLFTRRKL